jgi:dTDP-4-dehydrorhamnose 3,5-epimerase
MKFTETKLKGAYVIELEKREDDRGFFARVFCQNEFKDHGLEPNMVQANMSTNPKKGTLRGMHRQVDPHQEVKVVRCTKGAIYDVIVDLRKDSPTYKQWFGIELTDENYKMLYVPKDFAHGYLSLKDNSEVMYLVSEFYTPGAESGLRYNDPAFDIKWPIPIEVISEKDAKWEDYKA